MEKKNYLSPMTSALSFETRSMLCQSANNENYDVLNPIDSGDYDAF